jgi:hypothetical protein
MQSLDHTLATYFGEEPADSSVLRIFHRVLAALDTIYATGKGHPPLSPYTIRLDNSNQPHIPSSSHTHENADTIAFGSAKYSAPEAFLRNGDSSCSEAADCYVLGFIFYEILIGKRLFLAQFAALENGPPSVWLKWHADKTLKARSLTELRPNLGYFARLIDGMMEKDSSKRINSISQLLHSFSTVEAQTTYHGDFVVRPAAELKFRYDFFQKSVKGANAASSSTTAHSRSVWGVMPYFVPATRLLRKILQRATAASARVVNRFASRRNLYVCAGVLLLVGITILVSLLLRRERASLIAPQPMRVRVEPGPYRPLPPTSANTASALAVPAPPEWSLQIESHLPSGALLFLDDLRPVTLSRNGVLIQKTVPGRHKIRFVSHRRASLNVQLNIGTDVSLIEIPRAQFLRYVLLASNGNSAKLYATPEAHAGLPGQPFEAVPEDGLAIANDQQVNVSLVQDSKTQIHLTPLPTGSIRLVVEPGVAASLTPVRISANVPDADILINGEKQTRRLQNGIRVVRLPPGEYRVRLVRPEYRDSAEQHIVLNGSEQQVQLPFTLAPVVKLSRQPVNSLPAHDSGGGVAANPETRTAQPSGSITFHLLPDTARLSCRREDGSQVQDCANNQPCLLPMGAYEVTAKAEGFKTEIRHIDISPGDNPSSEWKLEAIPRVSALNPEDIFENGQTWTIDANGWWTHAQSGYSFMRANQGTFAFDVVKPSGVFVSKKISLVVNYKSDGNRVLYSIDEHKLRRNERVSGIEMPEYFIAHQIPTGADYRFTLELSTDRVIIRNLAGQTLDNLRLTDAARGKVGFSGKLKLKVIQAKYSQ